MSKATLVIQESRRIPSIIALNIASALSQLGQYGLGTTLIPIALKIRNASAENIGFTSAVFWLGMLFGLLLANQLTRHLGYRFTVILGVLMSAVSFALLLNIDWHWWSLPAAAIGFGTGLRWIALETWLYRLVSANARGRIVGLHETLLGISAILGPLIIVAFGATKPTAFYVASVTLVIGIFPLIFAHTLNVIDNDTNDIKLVSSRQNSHANLGNILAKIKLSINLGLSQATLFWFGFGALVAGLGGWIEGSILALLPVYSADVGQTSTDAAWLLTLFQMGAMVCQFPIGWLADHKGLLKTTQLSALVAFAALILALSLGSHLQVLAIAVFILGGVIAGFLTLGIIWAIHNNTGTALSNGVRQVSIVYTTLSAAGPFVTGLIISHSSSHSLFWQQLVVVFILLMVLQLQPRDN
jgi:MFS family permease